MSRNLDITICFHFLIYTQYHKPHCLYCTLVVDSASFAFALNQKVSAWTLCNRPRLETVLLPAHVVLVTGVNYSLQSGNILFNFLINPIYWYTGSNNCAYTFTVEPNYHRFEKTGFPRYACIDQKKSNHLNYVYIVCTTWKKKTSEEFLKQLSWNPKRKINHNISLLREYIDNIG